MDKKLIDSYLDNIEGLVVDEDKIVTYKSLSRSLGIHVNTAKQLLHTYLIQQNAKNAFPISATYLLAGKLADGSFNITIVNESDLEMASSKFLEITSEHVYSVQKGKNVKEINMLCGVDKGLQESTSLVIKSSKCIKKPKKEVKKNLEPNDQDNKEAINKAFGCEKETKVESPVKKEQRKGFDKISPKKQKSQGVLKKTGNIASMFAKVTQKNAEKLKSQNEENRKSMPSIFDKVQPKTVASTAPAKAEEKNVPEKLDILSSDDDFEEVQPKRGKKGTSKGSPRKKEGKKRKRIRTGSDNDSESDNGEPPETPVEEEVAEPLPVNATLEDEEEQPNESKPRNKRKKRKIVDKTVMNEDGYLETKKEMVLVTDSEDDEETKPKLLQPSAKPNKSANLDAPKKQSTLFSFFKKI